MRERDGIGNESMDSGKLRSYILLSLKGIPFFSFYGKTTRKGAKILVDNMNSYARYRIGSLS